ncbi:DUF2637 domain-containing protein [Catellatospora sichuanensis]|uniref:DUF2637 domain-containing protein n=1 Tax=Catellatospora sichuanensis TaxID=1969805 RepID=UPI001182EF1B|nr:DUF2637 domain-containing protein [Catellatospora sichuanensis]
MAQVIAPSKTTFYTIKGLVLAEAIGCFYFSYGHIREVVMATGADEQFSAAFPLMLDGLAVLGFIGRTSAAFDAAGKKAGTWIMVLVGIVSFICNVLSGETRGQQMFGALTVLLFVGAEWFASKLKLAPVVVIPDPEPEVEETEEEESKSPLKGKEWTPEMKAKAAETRMRNRYLKASPTEKRELARQGLKPADL